MDALQFFGLHRAGLRARGEELLDEPEAVVRGRPEGLNSIAWLIWHISRCEDVGVNRIVTDRQQVLFSGTWPSDLLVQRQDIGTSMTDLEVTDLSQRIDLTVLRSYWGAVFERTAETVSGLDPTELDTPVGPAAVHHLIVREGVFGMNALAEGFEAFWAQQPNKGWFLAQLALVHSWGHIYDARITRSLLRKRADGRTLPARVIT